MENHQHLRRPARVATYRILAAVVVLVPLAMSGCALTDNSRPPMPMAVTAQPSTAIIRRSTPLTTQAPVEQAVYVTAEGAAVPEPQSTVEAGSQPPAATESTPIKKPMPDIHSLASEEVPTPPAMGALTLDDAIAETLQSDPKLRGAMESIRQAQGDFTTSALLPNPSVQTNGVFLPLRTFTPAAPGGPPELDVIGTFAIDWWLFGKRAAAMANAQLGVSVSNADYGDQVRQRMANTASAYFDVLEARAMLKLSQDDLESLLRVEQITRQGVRFGGAGTIEAERIRLSVLDAQRDQRTREATLKTKKAQFRAAIGRRISAPDGDVAGSLDVPKPATPISVAQAISLAEQNRPDIISLRRQVARARAAITVEQTKARPTVTPSFGYQYQYQNCNGVADASSFTAQMNVSLPLFDHNQGNISKAESVLAQSSFSLQAQLVQTEADIEQAVAEFQAAYIDVTTIGKEQLLQAQSVRDRTVAAFRLGGKTLLEVIDAERAYRDTYRTYIMSQSGYWHALHRLNAAVGQQVLR